MTWELYSEAPSQKVLIVIAHKASQVKMSCGPFLFSYSLSRGKKGGREKRCQFQCCVPLGQLGQGRSLNED